jgi:hypothetical protein
MLRTFVPLSAIPIVTILITVFADKICSQSTAGTSNTYTVMPMSVILITFLPVCKWDQGQVIIKSKEVHLVIQRMDDGKKVPWAVC